MTFWTTQAKKELGIKVFYESSVHPEELFRGLTLIRNSLLVVEPGSLDFFVRRVFVVTKGTTALDDKGNLLIAANETSRTPFLEPQNMDSKYSKSKHKLTNKQTSSERRAPLDSRAQRPGLEFCGPRTRIPGLRDFWDFGDFCRRSIAGFRPLRPIFVPPDLHACDR